tara:strand:+ start:2577 stop:2957 length:381 start_codon:yes stop_codon:yes gene_type:complete
MRVDKYLWSIRYYKTRSQATRACKKGHVKVLEQSVKPARDVFPGDRIEIRKNQVQHQIEVIELPPSRVGAKWVDRYRKDHTPKEAFAQQEFLQEAQDYYRKKGTGRPTKKDRRDLEDFAETQSEEE